MSLDKRSNDYLVRLENLEAQVSFLTVKVKELSRELDEYREIKEMAEFFTRPVDDTTIDDLLLP